MTTTIKTIIESELKGTGFKDAQKALGELDQKASASSNAFADFAKSAAVVTGAVVGVGVAAKQAFDFAEEGAQIQQITESFNRMNETVFKTPNLLNDMSAAVRGTVSEVDLMQGILTLTAGASQDMAQRFAEAAPQLLEIAKASNKLNPSLGDTAFLYESLSLGIKRNSPLTLDNLGIVVKVGEANEKYAAQLGKTVEQLTAEEKTVALLNATLESGGRIIEQVGGSTESATDSYAQLKVELQETTGAFKQMAADGLTPIISGFNDVVSGAREFKAELQGATASGIVEAKTIDDLKELAKNMQQLSRIDTTAASMQMQDIGEAVARASTNSLDFEKNLVAVLGTSGAIRVAGKDFREFYRQFSNNEAIKESTSAMEQHLLSIEENKKAITAALSAFEEAPPTFLETSRATRELAEAYDRNAEAARGLLEARIDKVAEDTKAKAEADKAAAEAAEEHARAMQRQAEEMARVNATTGDYFTTISSGGGFESFIEYGLQAADVAGANALQLAAYAEKAGLAEDASQNLGKALGQAAADAAAANFAQTGDLDTYLTRLQEIQNTVENFPSLDELFDQQNRILPQMEEDPFFRIKEDTPAALQLLQDVTTAGVTGFTEMTAAAGDVTSAVGEIGAALQALPSVTVTIDVVTRFHGDPIPQGKTVQDAAAAAGIRQ